ncbi:YceH family protein [Geomonas sp. Red32]|uniref:YceH family protein n=1 Tax=Geomonas sp. Red32 TaxID=2912856 RepID=UPI00202CF9E8|nr:YceH family protein [Geomonas sp. Red32]MCM0081000.1 YceH family protein [Geomonas sp. Red32]
MKMNLDQLEIRVLGSLIEKELSTPENYPLSLNALVAACNQKSNREPAMSLTEAEVLAALERLGARGLARLTTVGGRVPRYCHSVTDKLGLAEGPRALLAELMLRGPQTPGELRSRCDRMASFADVAAMESAMGALLQAGPPLVVRLPRQPGRKEPRYAQLFAGMPEIAEESETDDQGWQSEEGTADLEGGAPARAARSGGGGAAAARLAALESEVGELRGEVAGLRREIEELIDSLS